MYKVKFNYNMKISVKGKFLSDFPEVIKYIDLERHNNLDYTKIQAGSNVKYITGFVKIVV